MSDSESDYSDDDAHIGGGDRDAEETYDGAGGEATLNVDVGSSLTSADWADIDNSDLVAKVRGSAGFRIMREIQPWDGALDAPPDLMKRHVFEYFYTQRKDSDFYKKLAKDCFPSEYERAGADKSEKKRLANLWAGAVLDELKAMRDGAKHTLRWINAIKEAQAGDLLFLKREALTHGPGSVQEIASQIVWDNVSNRIKDQTFAAMHAWTNKSGAQSGGVARMYKHQHELIDQLDKHYAAIGKMQEAKKPLPKPLHVILSTPTGSGKTFTAILVHLRLLKVKYPDAILLYSVPTKQVLKRVGQECEAHAVPYWTAARDNTGDGTLHQVRRPYSIRDKARNKKALRAARAIGEKVSAGSGTIQQQLEYAADVGYKLKDHGAGKPDIIIADLNTTAALLKACKEESSSSFYHESKILLYFDEPNMGIHLDPNVLGVVSSIQANMPLTAVLASATLGAWEGLEPWWRGPTDANQITISLEPYELPMAKLAVFNEGTSEFSPMSPLNLIENYAEYQRVMEDYRLPTLLLRHLTARHGNDLLQIQPPGGPWDKVQGDVKSLRLAIEPTFTSLSQKEFERLQGRWKMGEDAPTKVDGIRGALSKEGVTMVGCLDPRKVAFELAGFADQEAWIQDVHKLNNKLKEAERMVKENAKAEKRKKKDDEDEAKDGGDEGGVGVVTLRPMLKISLAEALEADINTLVMLSKGIAYACGSGTEPMVKRLYNQALLTVPDSLRGRSPPLNVLVVDYSSIYGTDCPAVDTLLLQEDLGRLLAWEDLQQFLGRLRRDGTAVFYSKKTLRRAALGAAVEEEETTALIEFQKLVENSVLDLEKAQKRDTDSVTALVTKLSASSGRSAGEVASYVLASVISFALSAPSHLDGAGVYPATIPESDKELLAAITKRVEGYSDALENVLKKMSEQVRAVSAIEALSLSANPFASRTGGARVLGIAAQVLKMLYDADILSEEALFAWANAKRKELLAESDGDARFFGKAKPFIQWLSEASDEDSDEEEE
ncbi:predicted protein [Ostreococcus lucimarinus CCE9901]|jgi:hypothetical protein|uniref:W2 domain-containing protein n=1 Tax=Ostreococcus lucimarinus (strain CCE9901) TaxID=436017 RepID=A4SB89_OSTLU|nr:predicted protein [Ostreococcus lucimarinus CCE9901]ABP00893.1 predicted protein [Ostreococcus lucimarinus CCE9901]|tara:strand:+ start:785 stop:3802 length:3018 start_codon:yes stop_codon:yes gene_type:complete|eukprot:XP_001422576.1 predicted protein [Ostreococcus lucimarinus CCE9901]